ncbi:hypothetical protein JMJ35_009037 [Cladonia borealis]|uniref:Heterokaryon incompatibility domain-containing protein n=1 Tax=Cladonia borealis TaxID=184061 RepID=A0AA39QVS5_9LECA|nr:hypothetical protein JMJ35_009037 [Cladonia borealis]
MSLSYYTLDQDFGGRIQFDKLCELCSKLFDSEAAWGIEPYYTIVNDRRYRFHHDIRTLERSADAGCHLCNLILSQINLPDLERMRKDLDEAFVSSCRQIGILIHRIEHYYKLQVNAWRRYDSPPSGYFAEFDHIKQQAWSKIAELDVNPEEQDYTNEERSTSYLNCSNATLLQIAQWMGECLTSHSKCFDIQTVTATRDILPLRLLDLAPALHPDLIKLEYTEPLPVHTVYATLSHCWGGHCKTSLTTSSLAKFQTGIHLNTLPRTFQEAVLLTRKLGIRYLWIDALCIVQDSHQDWSHQASLMGDFYANSSLTISATGSSDSDGGLYHSRSPLSVWPCRITAKWDCFPVDKLVLNRPGWAEERALEPLSTRGWAFQEWLLSKRTIHLSKDQVRWECHCLAASEVYPKGLEDHDIDFHGLPTKSVIKLLESEDASDLWRRIRTDYSEKHLTVATDKLTAFAGIARMVHKVLKSPKEDYVAGLWRPELMTELLWERHTPRKEVKVIRKDHLSQYIAPSWSWASIDGCIWYPLLEVYNEDQSGVYADIVEAKTFPQGDEYGPVNSGFLIIRGSLYYVELASSLDTSSKYRTREWKASFTQGLFSTHKWSSASLDNDSYTRSAPSTKDSFFFLPMRSTIRSSETFESKLIGLLLEKTGNGVHQYRRSGLLTLYGLVKDILVSCSNGLLPIDSHHDKNVDTSSLHTIEIV